MLKPSKKMHIQDDPGRIHAERMTRLARRLWLILGVQLLTYVVALIYLDGRFHAGFDPLPFLAAAFVLGLIVGLASRLVIGNAIASRLALIVGVIALLEVVIADSRIFFSCGLIPSLGALAITLPLPRPAAIAGDA